jgi:hypothetical protein
MCHHHERDGEREAYLEAMREELDVEAADDDPDDTTATDEAEDPAVEAEPQVADD